MQIKILTPMLAAAGCDSKIQLLTAKSLYEKADVTLPIMIEADQQYFDTVTYCPTGWNLLSEFWQTSR